MTGFAVEQSLSMLLDTDSEPFACELYTKWVSAGGYMTSDFDVDIEKLVLLDAPRSGQLSPEILYCGEDALASKTIGQQWSESLVKTDGFKDDFRQLVGQHYTKAQKTEAPVFDLVSAPTSVCGNTFNFRYERLILPVWTLAGALFLYCYSFAPNTSLRRLNLGSSDESLQCRRRQNRHHEDLFASEEFATQCLLDKPLNSPNAPHTPPILYPDASNHR